MSVPPSSHNPILIQSIAKSCTNRDLEMTDLMFNNPHFSVLLIGAGVDPVLFLSLGFFFLCLSHFLLVYHLFYDCLGADTVSKEMGFGGITEGENPQRGVGLQLQLPCPNSG